MAEENSRINQLWMSSLLQLPSMTSTPSYRATTFSDQSSLGRSRIGSPCSDSLFDASMKSIAELFALLALLVQPLLIVFTTFALFRLIRGQKIWMVESKSEKA